MEPDAPMDDAEFREVLDELGWSPNFLADMLSRDRRTVRRMANGADPIPPAVATFLRQTIAMKPELFGWSGSEE